MICRICLISPCGISLPCFKLIELNFVVNNTVLSASTCFALFQCVNISITFGFSFFRHLLDIFSAPEPKAHLSRRLKCTIVITRCPSSVCLSVRPSLTFTFSTSSLKPLNGIQLNLTGSKISTSSTTFVFFGPIGKTRWPPWPLIG